MSQRHLFDLQTVVGAFGLEAVFVAPIMAGTLVVWVVSRFGVCL